MYLGDKMNRYESIANKLKIVGHPVRLQILDMLRQGELCVCHIEHALNKRQAYVSQHLMVLRDAGLVNAHKKGMQVYYRLAHDQIGDLLNLVIGSSAAEGFESLAGCRCSSCSTRVPHTTQG